MQERVNIGLRQPERLVLYLFKYADLSYERIRDIIFGLSKSFDLKPWYRDLHNNEGNRDFSIRDILDRLNVAGLICKGWFSNCYRITPDGYKKLDTFDVDPVFGLAIDVEIFHMGFNYARN